MKLNMNTVMQVLLWSPDPQLVFRHLPGLYIVAQFCMFHRRTLMAEFGWQPVFSGWHRSFNAPEHIRLTSADLSQLRADISATGLSYFQKRRIQQRAIGSRF